MFISRLVGLLVIWLVIWFSADCQSKKVTEDDLRREFEIYGNIERIRLVLDRKGKSKSYAFIVYERERDMKGQLSTTHSHGGTS